MILDKAPRETVVVTVDMVDAGLRQRSVQKKGERVEKENHLHNWNRSFLSCFYISCNDITTEFFKRELKLLGHLHLCNFDVFFLDFLKMWEIIHVWLSYTFCGACEEDLLRFCQRWCIRPSEKARSSCLNSRQWATFEQTSRTTCMAGQQQ